MEVDLLEFEERKVYVYVLFDNEGVDVDVLV